MALLREKTVILDGAAKPGNLLSDIVGLFIHQLSGLGNSIYF